VQVTHPFHPLSGRSLELVDRERRPAGDVLLVRGESGQLRKLPAAWTSAAPVDAFAVVAAGRARVRPDDLASLAALIEGLRAAGQKRG
jgi:hypothetical protein